MLYYFAPLEGITNALYRSAHRAQFPTLDKYFAPFFVPGSQGLSAKDRRELSPEHNPQMTLVPQVLSNRSEAFLLTAEHLAQAGFSEVNLNLGCPSGTVFSKGRGAGALADLDTLRRFLDDCFAKTPLPISIKTRIGVADPAEWADILALLNSYPLHELIVHPRLRTEFYRGKPHLDAYAMALAESRAPVVYSGDLFTVAQIRNFVTAYPQTKAIMLGRGLIANPALAAELMHGTALTTEQLATFHDRLYARYRAHLSGAKPLLHKMKELWHYMICLFPNNEKHAKRLRKAQSLADYEAAVAAVFRELTLVPTQGYSPPPSH